MISYSAIPTCVYTKVEHKLNCYLFLKSVLHVISSSQQNSSDCIEQHIIIIIIIIIVVVVVVVVANPYQRNK
jgi:t-SNARE complex subunit (syntaxin)